MNYNKIFLLEASRQNSIEKNITNDGSGQSSIENSRWTNIVNFNFQKGDIVSVHSSALHTKGFSSEGTIEIGQTLNDYKILDNIITFKFIGYINSNGYYDCKLPYIGALCNDFFKETDDIQKKNVADNYNLFDMPCQAMPIYAEKDKFNYGAPIIGQNNFKYSFNDYDISETVKGYAAFKPNYMRTNYFLPIGDNIYYDKQLFYSYDNSKFIKLSNTYKGPYRANNIYNSDENSEFQDTEDACEAMQFQKTLRIDPIFESPTTITNQLNNQLHQINPIINNSNDDDVQPESDGIPIPHISSDIVKNINVNGSGTNDDNLLPWSQIAVKSLDKWQSIHAMMRTTLSYNGYLFDEDETSRLPRPVLFMNDTKMNINYRPDYNGAIEWEQQKRIFPRVTYHVDGYLNNDTNKTFEFDAYYTILPKAFCIPTNIQYTEKNIARIQKWFKNMEIYTGQKENETDIEADFDNWEVECDVGSSLDGINTQSNIEGTYDNKKYAPNGISIRQLHNGDFLSWETTQKQTNSSNFAYGLPMTGYAIDEIPELNKSLPFPRADYPDKEFVGMLYNNGVIETNTISEIGGIPHYFRNNKYKNCNMRLFSRLPSNWKNIIRFNNFPDKNKILADYPQYEGVGEWLNQPDLDSIDISLSGDLCILGIPLNRDKKAYNILENTFFTGIFSSATDAWDVTSAWQTLSYKFFFKFQNGTTDGGGTQNVNGGYDFYWFDDGYFQKFNDMYVYSYWNQDFKAKHDITGVTYINQDNDEVTPDLNDGKTFYFVNDNNGNPNKWIGIISTYDDGSYNALNIFFTKDNVFHEEPFYDGNDNVLVRKIVVQTTEGVPLELEPEYQGLNNQNIQYVDDTEKCCCFLLKYDSGTFNSDGSANISPDFALPQLCQSLFIGPSPSFYDSPATLLLNTQSSGEFQDGFINYMSIGAPDMSIEFDSTISRTRMFNLANNTLLGANMLPEYWDPNGGDVVVTDLSNPIIRFNDSSYQFVNINSHTTDILVQNVTWNRNIPAKGLNISSCGLALTNIYGQSVDNTIDLNDMIEITNSNMFIDSLLYKLGYVYTDFFPSKYGTFDIIHDPNTQGSLKKGELYKTLKPITTNWDINSSSQPAMSVETDAPNASADGLSNYMLSFVGLKPFNLGVTTSTSIQATNLPIKDDSSYFLIYSNITNSEYLSSRLQKNVVQIVSKFETAGDFTYSPASDLRYVITNPYKLSQIETEVRKPEGSLVSLNPNSVVIYKVERPMILLNNEEILDEKNN